MREFEAVLSWVAWDLSVMYGRIVFSRVLAIGERSEIGLYEEPWLESLFGLRIGLILAVFQIWGIAHSLTERLYIFVR